MADSCCAVGHTNCLDSASTRPREEEIVDLFHTTCLNGGSRLNKHVFAANTSSNCDFILASLSQLLTRSIFSLQYTHLLDNISHPPLTKIFWSWACQRKTVAGCMKWRGHEWLIQKYLLPRMSLMVHLHASYIPLSLGPGEILTQVCHIVWPVIKTQSACSQH